MNNEKGFTLLEVVAVLVILGILAATAIPRYLELAQQSKISAAQAEVAEIKATMHLAYAKYYMSNGSKPTIGSQVIKTAGIVENAATDIGVAPDIWNVTLSSSGTDVNIAVNSYGVNADNEYQATGTWRIPQ